MDLYSSDEDIDLGIAQGAIPVPRSARQFAQRRFNEDISDKVFRKRYRVPRSVVDHLELKLGDKLKHTTERNSPVSPRDQIKVFLHFLGTNAFYHIIRDCHGVSTDTVFRTVHRVCDALFEVRNDYIKWPDNTDKLAQDFYNMARMPSVCGCIDGTHVPGVNFTNILRTSFSYESFAQSFFVPRFKVCTFLAQKNWLKSCL
jgi:hypothetical protein